MLHIINKSPYDRPALDSALKTGVGSILLIEDGVYHQDVFGFGK